MYSRYKLLTYRYAFYRYFPPVYIASLFIFFQRAEIVFVEQILIILMKSNLSVFIPCGSDFFFSFSVIYV